MDDFFFFLFIKLHRPLIYQKSTINFFQFTDIIFCRWLENESVSVTFADELTVENTLSKNLSFGIYCLFVSSLVIKIPTDLKTDKECQTKKIILKN
jgi:hypothetical protein